MPPSPLIAVSTTGIFCRPSCPARTPRRPNVRFFPTPAAAQAAGLRACRGEIISLRELRYIDLALVEALEKDVAEAAKRQHTPKVAFVAPEHREG